MSGNDESRAGHGRGGPQGHVPPEFFECIRCDGTGERVECYDDLCHAKGRCIHGNNTCELCQGYRFISPNLAEAWRNRDAFEAVELPGEDQMFRGVSDDAV